MAIISEFPSGGSPVLEHLTVNQEGTYTPRAGVDGFDQVTVSPASGVGTLARVGYGESRAKLGSSETVTELSGLYGPMGDGADDYILPVRNSIGRFRRFDTTEPFEYKIAFKLTQAPSGSEYIIMGSQVILDGEDPNSHTYHDLPLVGTTNGLLWVYAYYNDGGSYSSQDVLFTAQEFTATLNTVATVRIVYDGTDMVIYADDGRGSEVSKTISNFTPFECEDALLCFGGGNGHTINLAGVSGAYIDTDQCYIVSDGEKYWGVCNSSAREIVDLSGMYGPMGDGMNDYFVPVSKATQENVAIDTSQPFEIKCTVKFTQQLNDNSMHVFGGWGSSKLPDIRVEHYNSLDDRIKVSASYQDGSLSELVQETISPSGYVLPLNTDIEFSVAYDGADLVFTVFDGTNQITKTWSDFDLYDNTAVCSFATEYYDVDGLASCEGAYIDINKTYIKQGYAYLWKAVDDSSTPRVLAKLGSSSEIVSLRGLYGPMGDYARDYITPVSMSNRQNVEIDTAQRYSIEVAFKIASLPAERVAIFGALDATNAPMPAMFIDAGGTGIRFRIPYTFDGAILYYEDYFTTTEMGGTVPLNTEIKVSVEYNGTSSHGASYEVGAEEIVASVDDLTPVSVTSGLCIGANGAGTSAALAGESGAIIDIDGCRIKQGTTVLWEATGGAVIVPLTVTVNGEIPIPEGVDGFGPLTIAVPGGGGDGRSPRSEPVSTYQMDDFYAWFTFTSTAEEGT